jgi:biofilm PGA synthesis lipoprotein PgaB
VPGQGPLFDEWRRWKSRSLGDFLGTLVTEARQVNPRLLVAVNLYYETLLAPDQALSWLAQDAREVLSRGVDYLAVMSYHRQMKRELGLDDETLRGMLVGLTARARQLPVDPGRIIFKVQTVDWGVGTIPTDEWTAVRDLFRAAGPFGSVVLRGGGGDD